MRIDAHQHFWRYDPLQYPWITDSLKTLRRDFMPNELEEAYLPHGFEASIAVQARQSLEESRWLLGLADTNPAIQGVVGWVDLQSERVEEQIEELAQSSKLVGVRHVVQDEPADFMLRPAFITGLEKLRQFGLKYDFLLFPKHIASAIRIAQRLDGQQFVLDHMGKPPIRSGEMSPWREDIIELAKCSNVFCKVSGLVTEANWGDWKPADFQPYLDVVFGAFGIDRLMFGSDWPVCRLAASYSQVHHLADVYTRQFTADNQTKFFGINAARFYGI